VHQGTKEDQRGPLAGNFRPEQGLNGRLMRTNINLNKRKVRYIGGGSETQNGHKTNKTVVQEDDI